MLGFFHVMFTALGFSEEMESVGLCNSGGLCLSKLPEFSACITNNTRNTYIQGCQQATFPLSDANSSSAIAC